MGNSQSCQKVIDGKFPDYEKVVPKQQQNFKSQRKRFY